MKRLFVTTIVLFLSAATISAQEYSDDGFGFSGSNQRKISSNTLKTNNESKIFRVGGYMNLTYAFVPKSELDENMQSYGLMVELGPSAYVADILYLGTGFGYWYQQFNYDSPNSSSYDYEDDSHYLYIPLQIGFQYSIKKIGVFCNTGPQFAWLVSSKFNGEKIDIGDDNGFTSWTVRFGLRFGAGGELYALYQKEIGDGDESPFWGIGFGGHF